MVAGLLYLSGLITILVCIAIAGYGAPEMIGSFTAAMDAGDANMLAAIADLGRGLAWIVWPGLVGFALMGFGRIVMLLASIERSLRSGR